jgi:hypothetical protein
MGKKCLIWYVGSMIWAGCALSASVCHADLLFHVSLNTTPLMGHPAAPFYVDFQLTDGSGAGDANNTATINNFAFGGGVPTGSPTLTGGASGNLFTQVNLTDSNFFNEFFQQFTPGSTLSFNVQLTTNVDAGPTPDQFSFAILDDTLAEIPTEGLLNVGSDVFLTADINSPNPPIQSYASDPTRSPAGGGGPIDLGSPGVQIVPEPTTLALLVIGLAGLAVARRRCHTHPQQTCSR